jgi:hypothetical protein
MTFLTPPSAELTYSHALREACHNKQCFSRDGERSITRLSVGMCAPGIGTSETDIHEKIQGKSPSGYLI